MTKYQAFSAVMEMDEEWKMNARLQGIEIKEEDKVATLQDLLCFGG